jgi:hypothetical protein
MRVVGLIAILSFTLLASPAAAAAQSNISPPFTRLFRPPSDPLLKPAAPAVRSDAKSIAKSPLLSRLPPRVVCGMTVVPVDSSLDPKIVRPVPSDGTKFTLRIHKPPVYGQ